MKRDREKNMHTMHVTGGELVWLKFFLRRR